MNSETQIEFNKVKEIVNNLSIKDFESISVDLIDYNKYSTPKLTDTGKETSIKNCSCDLFSIIGNRVLNMDLTTENINLTIYLFELINLNRPQYYIDRRNWDRNLTESIRRFVMQHNDNAKLKTILWAVFFQSPASMSALTEMFSDFPPYLQIKVVRKLFQLMDQGKLNLNAESLYRLLGGGSRPLCLPLEITFSYLKLRSEDADAKLNNSIMLKLIDERDDHRDWEFIVYLLHHCNGRVRAFIGDRHEQLNKFYNGNVNIKKEEIVVNVPRHMCDIYGEQQDYNNKYFSSLKEYVAVNFDKNAPSLIEHNDSYELHFSISQKIDVLNLARKFNICFCAYDEEPVDFSETDYDVHHFCEASLSTSLDRVCRVPFYWCGGRPCFREPISFMTNSEWENYTILDFMRILNIPIDYVTSKGTTNKFGHYFFLCSFFSAFKKFYNHLTCRKCYKLMKPMDEINQSSNEANGFSCVNEGCENHGKIVDLNHCINWKKCNATIDSRDSKQCPNGQYICPECGACCSTEHFANRISKIKLAGGEVTPLLEDFVKNNLGHWEKNEFFCYKCGEKMKDGKCPNCGTQYGKKK